MNRTMLAAAASLAILACPDSRAHAEPARLSVFTPPERPLIVTRTVVRTLRDGNEIVARRSYLVTFMPDGQAFAVTRTLVASEITAPPQLAAIAELERQRAEPAGPVIRLDRQGIARVGTAEPGTEPVVEGASAARRLVADAGVAAADKRYADAFIAETAARGAAIPWPRDLFSPAAADSDERSEIALADGSKGIVRVAQRVKARMAGGAPASVIREVTTEIAGSQRISREEWTLSERTGP